MPTFVHASDQLSPSYTGELRVGDQAGATPRHTGGVSLILRPLERTTLVGGLTYGGSGTPLTYWRISGA